MTQLLCLAAGLLLIGCDRTLTVDEPPIHDLIAKAEASSRYKILPAIIQLSPDKAFLQGVRDRGYEFCYRAKINSIDENCSLIQEKAIHAIALILMMSNRKDLVNQSTKQRWVTEHPEVVERVLQDCRKIYQDAGAKDARILDVCISNLGDWSDLLPNPVGVRD